MPALAKSSSTEFLVVLKCTVAVHRCNLKKSRGKKCLQRSAQPVLRHLVQMSSSPSALQL